MAYRTIAAIAAAAAFLCTALVTTDADARGGARGGGARGGGAHMARGGGYHGGAAVRGGAHRTTVVRGGTVYRGGYRPGLGAAGAAVGAAAAGSYYYNNQCGYAPYPPRY